MQIHKFFELSQVMFESIFGTEKMYVECSYTIFIFLCDSCFQALFVTEKLYVEGQTTNSLTWKKMLIEARIQQFTLHEFRHLERVIFPRFIYRLAQGRTNIRE
jgi:hypothetical protein